MNLRMLGGSPALMAFAAGALIFAACAPAAAPASPPASIGGQAQQPAAAAKPNLSGTIKADGSSTVFPIGEAMAEEFQKEYQNVRVTVGISGTGGGFKKFCAGETDMSNASRSISAAEQEECAKNGITYIELPVAYDGLSVMVNPQNSWVTCLTKAELHKIWAPESQGQVTNWKQIRDSFPDAQLRLYGAGADSGTFDYFTLAVNGKEKASRGDYTASEDDNVIVQGISGDRNSIGYFGYAYYVENKGKLKLVSIDEKGDGRCISPDEKTIQDFSYMMARPIFIYVKTASARRPEVQEFVKFYLQNATTLVKEVGYIPFPQNIYAAAQSRFDKGVTGTAYTGGVNAKTPLDQLYR